MEQRKKFGYCHFIYFFKSVRCFWSYKSNVSWFIKLTNQPTMEELLAINILTFVFAHPFHRVNARFKWVIRSSHIYYLNTIPIFLYIQGKCIIVSVFSVAVVYISIASAIGTLLHWASDFRHTALLVFFQLRYHITTTQEPAFFYLAKLWGNSDTIFSLEYSAIYSMYNQ